MDMKRDARYAKKGNLLSTVAKLCFAVGALSFIPTARISRVEENTLLWIWTLGLMFVLAPVLGIVGNIISIRKGRAKHKWWVLTVIFLEGLVLFIFGPWIVPCFYTAPTFSHERMNLFYTFISFAKQHSDHKYLRINRFGDFDSGNQLYFLDMLNREGELREKLSYDDIKLLNAMQYRLEQEFSPEDIEVLREVTRQLDRTRLAQVIFVEGIVLFVAEAAYRKPVLYGAAYSLSGENPNNLESDELRYFGPYTEIAPRWYISKNLRLRERILSPIINPPKSLIDKSLSVLPEELDALEEP